MNYEIDVENDKIVAIKKKDKFQPPAFLGPSKAPINVSKYQNII